MICPFCNQQMEDGYISVNGYCGIMWENQYKTPSLKDKVSGKKRMNKLD